MKAKNMTIHNFRSILHAEISLDSYSLLVGVNNSGKSNIIDAIRVFYEKDLKFDHDRDFPKMDTPDQESWVEIEYEPSSEEFQNLKSEYRLPSGTFKIRRYFQSSEKDADGKTKNGIYAYVGNKMSDSRFYGYKNVQKSKLGDILHIPAVSRISEHTRLTGPSVLRDLINTVMKRVVEDSVAYKDLQKSFEKFEQGIKTETTEEGHSLESIEKEITNKIEDWGASFQLTVNSIAPDDMVKSLINHQLHDEGLDQPMSSDSYGQGFQRHLIFTLIQVAAQFAVSPKPREKKEFSPDMTWILFEEPEAFLHPCQIDILNRDLGVISQGTDTQVLISTHNPQFVSRNTKKLTSLIRLHRTVSNTTVRQIDSATLENILNLNQQDLTQWQAAGLTIELDDLTIDMESVKYALWLDPRRCAAFFANKILLVEGPTETALVNYMEDEGYLGWSQEGIFVLDTMGKYNLHRFMNLFGELGISHYVLYDQDNGRHKCVEDTIKECSNQCTKGIDYFPNTIEDFLEVPKASEPHRKPQHIMYNIQNGTVTPQKLAELAQKIRELMDL